MQLSNDSSSISESSARSRRRRQHAIRSPSVGKPEGKSFETGDRLVGVATPCLRGYKHSVVGEGVSRTPVCPAPGGSREDSERRNDSLVLGSSFRACASVLPRGDRWPSAPHLLHLHVSTLPPGLTLHGLSIRC